MTYDTTSLTLRPILLCIQKARLIPGFFHCESSGSALHPGPSLKMSKGTFYQRLVLFLSKKEKRLHITNGFFVFWSANYLSADIRNQVKILPYLSSNNFKYSSRISADKNESSIHWLAFFLNFRKRLKTPSICLPVNPRFWP